ncbi:hypothetical protein VTN00DRAFT_76 [Thermoascus crustaceus]|uniref:uncharacterized protein n=1 Tax=Thermoascus crustaceus TaxID=5088 RepID=UPI003743662A
MRSGGIYEECDRSFKAHRVLIKSIGPWKAYLDDEGAISGALLVLLKPEDIITRDVCILGGGATGTYAAVCLKDMGQSVAVIERNDRLGGHAETLYLPDAALLYRLFIENFSYLKEGVMDLPDPVQEELVRPFGEFVEKHGLGGALKLIFTFAQGHGNILEVPALYLINHVGMPQVNALFAGYIWPRNGAFELYRKAAEYIDPDVLYQTTSQAGQSEETPNYPTLQNLKDFDLDESQTRLFKKWLSNSYYSTTATSPTTLNVVNTNLNNQPGSLPYVPLQWHLDSVGLPGYLTTKIVAPGDFAAQDARDLIVSDIRRMRAAGTYSTREPDILAFGDHTPVTMNVSPDDIRQGFLS